MKISNKKRVYLDNAATTALRPEVASEMITVMKDYYGNPSSIHADGRQVRTLIEQSRKQVASAINASVGEVFFTSGGTESNNMALKCAVRDLGVERIVTSKLEHHVVLHTADRLKTESNVQVDFVNFDENGCINLQHLEKLLGEGSKTTLVSLMHANNEIGTMIDLKLIGTICRSYGAYFHSDTVQTMAHFPIDVQDIPIDFLSGSAHKFHGPKGIGYIYINNAFSLKPLIDGGSQERNMRAGTENVYGIVGLGKALQMAVDSMEEDRNKIIETRDYLKRELLTHFDDIRFHGSEEGDYLYTVLNVSFPPMEHAGMLLLQLDIHGISASGGSACSSGADAGSHVMQALKADPSRKSIRFSFSHDNTIQEMDYVVSKLKSLIPVKQTI